MDLRLSFRYFAYGSNLWPPQMRSRCPSARVLGPGTLEGWSAVYDKPSTDGSAKLNIRPRVEGSTPGVVYEVEEGERQALDSAEPLYTPTPVHIDGQRTLTYVFDGEPFAGRPYDWYVATALLGAACFGLDDRHLRVPTDPDPLASGVRPASPDDLDLIGSILSEGLTRGGDRYYIHPGEYGWWVYHDDPSHPDHFSTWIQDETGFATIDSLAPREINVFTRPGADRTPLLRWCQRRLDGMGEIGGIADTDTEMTEELTGAGYQPTSAFRSYEWDLTTDLPEPHIPRGWQMRALLGEDEANTRRAASHAAFESTMPDAVHLQRYLSFMRSPVYVPERDLVAVSPEGRVGSFMIWWADDSGIAQIEPFGTHPDFHRRGVGRALLYHGLAEMKRSGMHTARVCTDDDRHPATAFYESCGFTDVGRLRWWRPGSSGL